MNLNPSIYIVIAALCAVTSVGVVIKPLLEYYRFRKNPPKRRFEIKARHLAVLREEPITKSDSAISVHEFDASVPV
jgi:hypothetical protein